MHVSSLIVCSAVLCLTAAASAQSSLAPGQLPSPKHELSVRGFDTTADGLRSATRSENTHVIRYALQYATEKKDPVLLDEAERLLVEDSGPMPGGKAHVVFVAWARLEAAKYLATFNRESGLTWLRNWGPRIQEDIGRSHVDVHLARVALDSAMFLAERMSDESLVHLLPALLLHESWSVRCHAARALGSFTDYANPHLEEAWLRAASVAPTALHRDPPLTTFISALNGSARKQVATTQAIIEEFEALAGIELEIAPYDERFLEEYPVMAAIDRNEATRISLEQLRDILRKLPARQAGSTGR